MGGGGDATHLPGESIDNTPPMELIRDDEKERIDIGSATQTHGLNWAFGDMYSPRPPPPSMMAPEPSIEVGRHVPLSVAILEPINPTRPSALPHGKQWRGKAFPDMRLCDYVST